MKSQLPFLPASVLVFFFPCTSVLRGGPAETPDYVSRELAALGDPYPGAGGEGRNFEFDFEPSMINNAGAITFGADICHTQPDGSCEEIGEAVFSRNSQGAARLLARVGDPAPGGGVFGPQFVSLQALNQAGDVAFVFTLEGGPYASGLYLFSEETGEVRNLVRPGDPAPCSAGGDSQFEGHGQHPAINNRGEVVFPGICTNCDVDPNEPPGEDGLAEGVFLYADGTISSAVCPGDPAPGGSVFDYATNPWINDRGDIAFGAHVAGEECIPLESPLACAESVYLMSGDTGEIRSIAHQGDPAPGGGTFRLAFGPILNNRGEVVFTGDLTPAPQDLEDLGVFLYSGGVVLPVARPGDPMPGGGNLRNASFFVGGCGINNCGEVVFHATLDSESLDIDGDGTLEPDQGLYVWSRNGGGKADEAHLRLVARTGTVLRDGAGNEFGTLAALLPPAMFEFFPDFPSPWPGVDINDLGEVIFTAGLTDNGSNRRGVFLLATPDGDGHGCAPLFVRGDCDANGAKNLTDAVFLLNHLFLGGPEPTCMEACNTDAESPVNLTDGVYLLNFLFRGGPPVPPPIVCEGYGEVDCQGFAACP